MKINSDRIFGHPDYDKVFEILKTEGYSTGSEEQYDKLIDEAGRRLFLESDGSLKNTVLITVEVSGDEDETFDVSYEPRCVWLHCSKRNSPMPIGNMIYPFNKVEVVSRDGKLLTLKLTK